MAVAVKNATATIPVSPPKRVFAVRGIDTIIGVIGTIASLAIVFYAIPLFWHYVLNFTDSFVGIGLLLLVMVLAAGGLGLVGARWMGPRPRPGLRAGIAVGCVLACLAGLVTSTIGHILENTFQSDTSTLGAGLTVAILVVLLALVGWSFTRPTFDRWMVNLDAQGWFSLTPFKRTQGQKVRRGTILGILILAGCGIYTLCAHWTAAPASQGMAGWSVLVPFSGGQSIMLLPWLPATVPVILGLASLWFAYRVVNLPVFADFLIATEAEMNKVSWTTRQRLVQDTIVVLVTVVLLTFFLFVVDWCWSMALKSVDVIHTPAPTEAEKPPQW